MRPVKRISSGSTFEDLAGYSRAVVVQHADHVEVFVSGCTGFDYSTMTIAEDVAVQIRQCFLNIADALTQAGGQLTHLVRVRYYLPEFGRLGACGAGGRRNPGGHPPSRDVSDLRVG